MWRSCPLARTRGREVDFLRASAYSLVRSKTKEFGSVRSRSRDHELKWCCKVRSLILAVLLTGFSLQVVECIGVQPSTATGSDDATTHFNRAVELHKKGNLYGAITEYRTALRLNPNEVEAHYNLGNALKALGRQADAREEFKKALGLLRDTPANQYKIKQVKQRIRELE